MSSFKPGDLVTAVFACQTWRQKPSYVVRRANFKEPMIFLGFDTPVWYVVLTFDGEYEVSPSDIYTYRTR